jgi:hypothetical protein
MYFTKCVDCGDLLEVSFVGEEAHPHCRPGEIYQLTSDWCDAAQRDDVVEANRLQSEIDKLDRLPELGASALWYASIGWRVFPLRPGEKVPATKNGLKDGTVDADQIREWWSTNQSYNIGICTGELFDVIDVDGPIGIKSMAESDDVLPDIHGRVATPRGVHYLIRATGNGNRVGVLPGVDFRGSGGFVVGPPSQMDGRRWMWLMPPSPEIRAA